HHGKFMRNTGSIEGPAILLSDLYRRVRQDVKIICKEQVQFTFHQIQACGNLGPKTWKLDLYGRCMVQIAIKIHESTSRTDKGMLIIHKIGAYRSFKAINPVGNLYLRTF